MITRIRVLGLALLTFPATFAMAQHAAEQSNMELVGYNDLQARSAYQPVIQKQGDRWIAYIGHHGGVQLNPLTGKQEPNGTSIVDVTDPKHPKYLAHIPGETGNAGGEGGGAQMVRVCSGNDLPHADKSKFYMLRSFGNSAHEMWDVTDPAKPSRMNVIVSGLRDTHKSWWECDTGIAYLVGGVVGWRTPRMAHDLRSERSGEAGLHSQFRSARPAARRARSDAGEPARPHLHRARRAIAFISPTAIRSDGMLEIVDREKLLNGPKEPTDENLRYPVISTARFSGGCGRAHGVPAAAHELPEFAEAEEGQREGFRRGDRRDRGQRMPGVPADGAHLRCQRRNRNRRACPPGRSPRPAAISAARADASARIPPMKISRRFITTASCFSRISTRRARVDVRDPFHPQGNRLLHPGHHRQDRQALRRPRARTRNARSRFRRTTSRWTTAATSTPSIAPTPACTSWRSPARRARWRIF